MASSPDVVIVGGGVVGLTTALAVATLSSLDVVVLETRSHVPCGLSAEAGGRVSAISPASQRIFDRLGVWDWVAAREISPFEGMHVWSAFGVGAVDFRAREAGVPVLGHIVANQLLEAGLTERLQQCPNVQLVYSCTPSALQFEVGHVDLLTLDGANYRAKLVIAADGAHSTLRTLAGFSQTERPYGQRAMVATVRTRLPHARTARQCFLPTGPLAFLPLLDPSTCSIVWSADDAEADRLQALSDEAFAEALGVAFQHRLGEITAVSGRRSFPLVMRHAETYVRDRFALVGDAVHTLHPLAGQGMNLGLLAAATLAETVTQASAAGRDFAAFHTLRRYERARKTGNLTMLLAMDFFRKVGSHTNPLVQGVWQKGMQGVGQLKPVKRLFMDYALGKQGDLPRLASVPDTGKTG